MSRYQYLQNNELTGSTPSDSTRQSHLQSHLQFSNNNSQHHSSVVKITRSWQLRIVLIMTLTNANCMSIENGIGQEIYPFSGISNLESISVEHYAETGVPLNAESFGQSVESRRTTSLTSSTIPPSATPCSDDTTWEDEHSKLGCHWVAKRAEKRCARESNEAVSANDACALSCGNCPSTGCQDDRTWQDAQSQKGCIWVAKRAEKRCKRESSEAVSANDACALSCGNCALTSTVIPPSDATATPCSDDTTWEDEQSNLGCHWVAKSPYIRCKRESSEGVSANDACALSCGNCPSTGCQDDRTWQDAQSQKGCLWVAQRKTEKRCKRVSSEADGLVSANDACALTCGNCAEPTSSPTAKPTAVPSKIPSKVPTTVPSKVPSSLLVPTLSPNAFTPSPVLNRRMSMASPSNGNMTVDLGLNETFLVLRYRNLESRMRYGLKMFNKILHQYPPSKSTSSSSGEEHEEGSRTIVAYSAPTSLDITKGKNWLYIKNFHYFLDHAIDCNKHSTIIITTESVIKEYTPRIMKINDEQCRDGQYTVELVERVDKCYDMQSMAVFLREVDTSNYDFYIYVNCGMVGPKTTGDLYWTDVFISRLINGVKMVGVSINLSFHPHVQSMAVAFDKTGIQVVNKSGAVYDCGIASNNDLDADKRWEIIEHYEMGMSQAILNAGYSIGSLTGSLGKPITISKSDIMAITDHSQQYFSLPPVISCSKHNIWDSNTADFVLPWGDDIWNENTFRTMRNGKSPLWSDFVFYKASRLVLLPGIDEEVRYNNSMSMTVVKDLDSVALPRLMNETQDICAEAKTNFREASKLFTIVTGYEHSGTTMLANLIKSDPGLAGGFECGLLYEGTKPSDFKNAKPFYDWSMWSLENDLWGLNEESRRMVVNAKCDAEMYATLHSYSPIFHIAQNKKSYLVDKTPGYLHRLVKVMDRTPGVPVVVAKKTEHDLRYSWKKRNYTDDRIDWEIAVREKSLGDAIKKYPSRVHIANTSHWYENPNEVLRGVYDFLGLEWREEYLSMKALNGNKIPGSVQSEPFNMSASHRAEISSLISSAKLSADHYQRKLWTPANNTYCTSFV